MTVLTILVGSFFFRELGFHTSCHCIGLNFPPYIDKELYFHILFLLDHLVSAESRRQFKPVLEGMRAAAAVLIVVISPALSSIRQNISKAHPKILIVNPI